MSLATDIEDGVPGMGPASGQPRDPAGNDESPRPDGSGASPRPDGSGRADRSGVRRCIVTRAVRPREELIRFVIGPDGTVVPDLGAELPGRGIWVSARRDVLEKACAKNAFSRAAKTQARIGADLPERVQSLLADRCLRLIGLARRAGEAAGGFEKVQDWVRDGRARLLVVAVDGSPGAKQKLRRLARSVPVVELFGAAELGAAFGRDQVVNAALSAGGLARQLEIETFRLSGFRPAADQRN